MTPFAEDAWDAWSPTQLFRRLSGLDVVWYVAGGWALDLWIGRETRKHEDLEICVLSEHTLPVRRALDDLEFFVAQSGVLTRLPTEAPLPPDAWQVWGADRAARCWRFDMMIDKGTPEVWVYKRDPTFTLPRSSAVRTSATGLPFLAPALVLLFKAKATRDKDDRDFRRALPRLGPAERSDLRRWLTALHPDHRWIGDL